MSIHLLQTFAMPESAETALADRFVVHKLHTADDPERLFDRVGTSIRAIAGVGVPKPLMDRLPALEIIANFGVGYDSIDVQAAKARNIRVTNTPDVLNDAVAELTIGLMLSLARRLPQADRYVRENRWPLGNLPIFRELGGTTLGIVGLGRIGREIATRAQAMKMRVVYHGRSHQPRQPYVFYPDLVDMARDVDWLVALTPGGAGTEKLISRAVLEALGPDGMFVNVARGSVADQDALIDLLANGGLGGAALDVFADEPHVPEALRRMENVILSPHQGSATRETRDAMGALVVTNLDAHFSGKSLLTPVA
ncbi:2-hydroxyacid dehydrogenase [Microbaculum marinisediminis]|uniref:2-hydroxyacid dehydrogenase n=1 Tax=Microbaculum marinisediminis TaxID=2931392 RepID=A0AAW5QY83_9HYPH|nr:2-hydroxyacid dehydrogenase [Microbaculum sp. A6E488]MCT8972945.1 2-hydroxyacid dehydrogenase [Microbaculum sp. A6E488]